MTKKEQQRVWQIYADAHKKGDEKQMDEIRDFFPSLFMKPNTWCAKKWKGANGEKSEIIFYFNGKYGGDVTYGFTAVDKEWADITVTIEQKAKYRQLDGMEVCRILGQEAKKRGYFKHYFGKGYDLVYDDKKNILSIQNNGEAFAIFVNGEWIRPANEIEVSSEHINDSIDYMVHHSKVMADISEKLFAPKTNKPKDWYRHKDGDAIIFFTDHNHGFGFVKENEDWKWMDQTLVSHIDSKESCWTYGAAPLDLLIKESERRGLTVGARFYPLEDGLTPRTITITGKPKYGNSQRLSICALHHQDGYLMVNGKWAEPLKNYVKNWYTNGSGYLVYFNTETSGWGFTSKFVWNRFDCFDLNKPYWKQINEDAVHNELIRYATTIYKHGERIKSALSNAPGKVGRIWQTRTGFDVYSSKFTSKDNVSLYCNTTGKWAEKL